jgi:hypothetical protein
MDELGNQPYGAVPWPVQPAYTVEDQALVGVGPPTYYIPLTRPSVVSELAKLKPGDDAQAVAFASQWGLLGYRGLIDPVRIAEIAGEPLDFIWGHAATIRDILKVRRYLQDGDEHRLENVLKAMLISTPLGPALPWWNGAQRTVTVLVHLPGTRPKAIHFSSSADLEVTPLSWAERAREFVQQVVTANLSGLKIGLRVQTSETHIRRRGARHGPSEVEPSLRWQLTPRCLLTVAYYHVARSLVAGADVEGCKQCGSLFFQHDRRQHFCPATAWTPGSAVPSLCNSRYRQRKAYKQSKEKEATNGEASRVE